MVIIKQKHIYTEGGGILKMLFESKVIPSAKLKINGKIKKAIDAYSEKKVPMRVMLTDFLAVKSKTEELAAADNPWAYFYKGIQGHEIESGVSHEETLFRFSAMTLKDQKPSDVINAAFYSNRTRNDSDFELGYFLPLFLANIDQKDRMLVVNPSPDIICRMEESSHGEEKFYAVSDPTVAGLYRLQFPESEFLTFDQMNTIDDIDAVCITNRDQKMEKAQSLLNFLSGCKKSTKIMGLVPCAWLDNPNSGVYTRMNETGMTIKQLLIVDSKVTVSTPRKKMILVLEKGKAENIKIYDSSYDEAARQFSVSDKDISINADTYLKTDKTILSCLKSDKKNVEDKKSQYNKAEEYKFSEEISLFYKIYSGRKNKYAGVAYYREIENMNLKTWGRKLSADIEKGLRADTREDVLFELERTVFNDEIYPIIRNDLKEKNIIEKQGITLKSLWFYFWNYLSDLKKYNHEYSSELFKRVEIADIMPRLQNENQIMKAISIGFGVESENVPYAAVEQIDLVLQLAVKRGILVCDPLEVYVSEYTNRATERQQDVRNALVKKHFTAVEEEKIMNVILKKQTMDGKCLACIHKSLLLAVGIRLFTGMAIREVAALKWKDFKEIKAAEGYQFVITKFVDSKGKLKSHSERENWKRFRIVPSAKILSCLLLERKKYLIGKGIDKGYLMDCPIILENECISDMKKGKEMNHCRPGKISSISNELIQVAGIPKNEIILPDERGELITDLNRYHGDIFLSNFRHKANHVAYLTIGEINYMIGIDAPDTFSRHYCDYSNDFLQKAIIQKLRRWEYGYENMATEVKYRNPSVGSVSGSGILEVGPFSEGVASVDILIKNDNSSITKVSVISTHGIKVNKTVY